jgi:hypothetical protein
MVNLLYVKKRCVVWETPVAGKAGGIVFNGATGTMYGNVTLQQDLTILSTHTLDLAANTLTVGSVTLTNEGTITKNGGTIAGTVGGGGTVNN